MSTPSNRTSSLPTGFAGSYDDYIDQPLSLQDLLVPHPAATFLFRIKGADLVSVGIYAEDIAVVDRSLTPHRGDFVLCILEGAFIVQEWDALDVNLMKGDDSVGTNNEHEVIGVISSIVRQFRRG